MFQYLKHRLRPRYTEEQQTRGKDIPIGISKRAWQITGAAAGGASLSGGGLAIKRLLQLDSQCGDYRKARENHNLATLNRLYEFDEHPKGERPYLIVSLGDSSVQGVGAPRVTESCPARLASSIAAQMDHEVFPPNLPLFGATIGSVELTQIPQTRGLGPLDDPYRPDLAAPTIGGSDVMTEDMALGQLEERLRRAPVFPSADALVSTIPFFGITPQESRTQDASDRIGSTVSGNDAHLVDLRSLTQEYSLPTHTSAYHAADLFHPNSAAYTKWAQLFANAWVTSRREAAPVIEDAPQWDMLSARAA